MHSAVDQDHRDLFDILVVQVRVIKDGKLFEGDAGCRRIICELRGHPADDIPGVIAEMTTGLADEGEVYGGRGVDLVTVGVLLLVATLMASLAKQLAMLLLRHPLAALLDYGTH